ncbi:MAG: hypothetical protein LC643_01260 [Bacteroidales bacterium]|nr:hypothetical protein [Bacteroidales bacterium]
MEDHNGNIWIGTSYGLNKLNPETGEIQIFHFESRILSLYEDSRKKIWVGTWSDGLFKLDPEKTVCVLRITQCEKVRTALSPMLPIACIMTSSIICGLDPGMTVFHCLKVPNNINPPRRLVFMVLRVMSATLTVYPEITLPHCLSTKPVYYGLGALN